MLFLKNIEKLFQFISQFIFYIILSFIHHAPFENEQENCLTNLFKNFKIIINFCAKGISMKGFTKKIIKYLLIGALTFVGAIVVLTYLNEKTFGFDLAHIKNPWVSAIPFFVIGFMLIVDLLNVLDGKGKKKSKGEIEKVKDSRGKEVDQYFDKDFVSEEDLKKNKDFNYHTLQTLKTCKKDGILVRAEEKGNNMEINFVQPIHTLVTGTTSSGKTWRYVVPTLQLMSMTAAKPSFVITDPKGELYDNCSNQFRKEGYDVKVLDLRDPSSSMQWNPLSYPYQMFHRSYNLDKEVRVHPNGDSPRNYNLIIQRQFDFQTTTWFEFNGVAYVDRHIMENDMRVIAKKLQDDTYSTLGDICTTLAPVESAKDPSWEKTARRLIHGVMMAMLEDSLIPELGLTEEKFNLYNVYKICNTTDNGRDTFATLKKYLFEYRDKFSKVPDLASQALQNADTTTKNYMGFVSGMMSLFSDAGISFMTSRTEVDFTEVDERPTAIFLIIPDEIRVRYPLAILFVTQLYKRLVDKAQLRGGKLKRNVYFLLDEFGNMPKFPEFGSSMAVGRSRGIFFILCVQSYSQLYQNYGQDEGKIIKDNCPIQVYIASEDMTTNKEFSELLGKKTIVITNTNKSTGPDGKESKSTSTQVQTRPIAYPEELMTFRDQGKIIIKTFTPNAALKTSMTYAFKAKCYDLTKVRGSYVERRMFDENAVFYDIKMRNNKMAAKFGTADDDDDDDLF